MSSQSRATSSSAAPKSKSTNPEQNPPAAPSSTTSTPTFAPAPAPAQRPAAKAGIPLPPLVGKELVPGWSFEEPVEPMKTRRASDEKNPASSVKPEPTTKIDAGPAPYPSASSPSGSTISDGDPPGFIAPPPKDTKPAGAAPPVAKRNYEEMEDIMFANPLSFKSMAFAIAATRGTELMVGDDRTHKVTSAYMHICCVYRRSGCPFILKLTKSKEGGWLMKSSKATDVDPKQRSVYRCRHPAGSVPDVPAANGKPTKNPPTTSHPAPGAKPKAAKKKSKLPEPKILDSGDEKEIPLARSVGRPPKIRTSMGSTSFTALKKADDSDSDDFLQPPSGDRALAPPFERSMMLTKKIVPALARAAPPPPPREPPTLHRFADAGWAPGPSSISDQGSIGPSSDRGSFAAPPPFPTARADGAWERSTSPNTPVVTDPHSSHPRYRSHDQFYAAGDPHFSPSIAAPPPPAPVVEPVALPEWTKFLTALDPELASLAETFASPALAVTPESFFAEDEEMRIALIDMLEIGTWPKLKLKSKLKAKGLEVWTSMKREVAEDVAMGDAVPASSSTVVDAKGTAMEVDSKPAALEVLDEKPNLSLSASTSPPSSEEKPLSSSIAVVDKPLPTSPTPPVLTDQDVELDGEPVDADMDDGEQKPAVHRAVVNLRREESSSALSEPMEDDSEHSYEPAEASPAASPHAEKVEAEAEEDMEFSDDSESEDADDEAPLVITPVVVAPSSVVATASVPPKIPPPPPTNTSSHPFAFPSSSASVIASLPPIGFVSGSSRSTASTAPPPSVSAPRPPSKDYVPHPLPLPPPPPELSRPLPSSRPPAPYAPSASRPPGLSASRGPPPTASSSSSRPPTGPSHASRPNLPTGPTIPSRPPPSGPSSSRQPLPPPSMPQPPQHYPRPPSSVTSSASSDQGQAKYSYSRPSGPPGPSRNNGGNVGGRGGYRGGQGGNRRRERSPDYGR